MQSSQFIYEYAGFNGVPSTCRFTFSKTITGLTICISDELPTNKGTSIRDFAEHLATHAYREVFAPNGTHVEEFIYLEHAPISPTSIEYYYSMVDCEWDDEGIQFIHPTRTTLTDEEVQTLLGQKKEEEPAAGGSLLQNSISVER